MVDKLENIKKEHEFISNELDEIEVAFSGEIVNYPNLIHSFKELIAFWEKHEKNEEEIFKKMSEKNYRIPYTKISFEHGILNRYKNAITQALMSGSEQKIRDAMNLFGKRMIVLLKKHIEKEDEIIYRIPLDL